MKHCTKCNKDYYSYYSECPFCKEKLQNMTHDVSLSDEEQYCSVLFEFEYILLFSLFTNKEKVINFLKDKNFDFLSYFMTELYKICKSKNYTSSKFFNEEDFESKVFCFDRDKLKYLIFRFSFPCEFKSEKYEDLYHHSYFVIETKKSCCVNDICKENIFDIHCYYFISKEENLYYIECIDDVYKEIFCSKFGVNDFLKEMQFMIQKIISGSVYTNVLDVNDEFEDNSVDFDDIEDENFAGEFEDNSVNFDDIEDEIFVDEFEDNSVDFDDIVESNNYEEKDEYLDEVLINYHENEIEKNLKNKKENIAGAVYILVNPAFSSLVKIGYADNVESRIRILNSNTGLPDAFHCYAIYNVKKRLVDLKIHKLIDDLNPSLRYSENREFYKMDVNKAYSILSAISQVNGDEEQLIINPFNDDYFKVP